MLLRIKTSWIEVTITKMTERLTAEDKVKSEVFGLIDGLVVELLPHDSSSRRVNKRFSSIQVGNQIRIKGDLLMEQEEKVVDLKTSIAIRRMKKTCQSPVQKGKVQSSESDSEHEDDDNGTKSDTDDCGSNTEGPTQEEAGGSNDQTSFGSDDLHDEDESVHPEKPVPRVHPEKTVPRKRAYQSDYPKAPSPQNSGSNSLTLHQETAFTEDCIRFKRPPPLSPHELWPKTVPGFMVVRGFNHFDGKGYRRTTNSGPPLRSPPGANEAFIFEQRFSNGRRRVIRIQTDAQEREGVNTLQVHEHWVGLGNNV